MNSLVRFLFNLMKTLPGIAYLFLGAILTSKDRVCNISIMMKEFQQSEQQPVYECLTSTLHALAKRYGPPDTIYTSADTLLRAPIENKHSINIAGWWPRKGVGVFVHTYCFKGKYDEGATVSVYIEMTDVENWGRLREDNKRRRPGDRNHLPD